MALETLIKKFDLKLPLEEFGKLDPRKPCSSDLFVSNNILVKNKNRNLNKKVWEFLMLKIIKDILQHYTNNLSCPEALGFVQGELAMQFLPTITAEYIVQKLPFSEKICLNGREAYFVKYVIQNLGALSRIKELEHLVHSDYQLRHILIDRGGTLYLIDVENAYIDQNAITAEIETDKMREDIRTAKGERAVAWFNEGYNSVKIEEQIAYKVVENIEQKYDVQLNFIERSILA